MLKMIVSDAGTCCAGSAQASGYPPLRRPAHLTGGADIQVGVPASSEMARAYESAVRAPGAGGRAAGLRSAPRGMHALRGGQGVGNIGELQTPGAEHLELKSPITYIAACKDQNGMGRLKVPYTHTHTHTLTES